MDKDYNTVDALSWKTFWYLSISIVRQLFYGCLRVPNDHHGNGNGFSIFQVKYLKT